MGTGFQGTFVISWSQTEVDGHWSAPVEALRVGASWTWVGQPVRVDGPAGVLPLGEAAGMADLRRRAADGVRKLLRLADVKAGEADLRPEPARPMYERGFSVTDGRRTWTLTLIDSGPGRKPLVMFLGQIPPAQTELWIVSHNIDAEARDQTNDAAGGVICFTPGTMILTETGPVAVELLREGARIQTKDNGCQEVVWIGSRRITGARLHAMPHLTPIRLREGALDKGVPDAGLLVSPDHRLVLRGPRAQSLFNCAEVLVTARDLVDGRAISLDHGVREVTYIHLLLPSHQIVMANGVETESFHPASAALTTMEDSQLMALFARLPGIATDPQTYGGFARRVLSKSETAILGHDTGRAA